MMCLNELNFEPMINASQISVTVKSGVVTLRGAVRDFHQKWVAEWAAKKIAGVKAIVNDIDVQLLPRDERSDNALAAAVRYHFEWDVTVPGENITVTASRGWVTLEGTVEEQYQKQRAEEVVRKLTGVKGIINLVSLVPKATPIDVRSRINEAFQRLVELDEDNIEVEMQDGTAILIGEVRSWAERDEAERAAWSAPGISRVENRIVVEPARIAASGPLDY